MPVAAIIPAAGIGKRFGEIKQFKTLNGTPLFFYALRVFYHVQRIQEIILVVPEENVVEIEKRISSESLKKKQVKIIAGGNYRQESVNKGLKAVSEQCDTICIHDGARPFVTPDLINSTIDACQKFDGAIAAVKATDTIKYSKDEFVEKTIDRDKIWLVQTPQTFRKNKLKHALNWAMKNQLKFTDESSILEKTGCSIAIVEGSRKNFKITEQEDWLYAETIVKNRPI